MSLAQGNNTPTRPRIEPGSPDPESDALTTRPVRSPGSKVSCSRTQHGGGRFRTPNLSLQEYDTLPLSHRASQYQVGLGLAQSEASNSTVSSHFCIQFSYIFFTGFINAQICTRTLFRIGVLSTQHFCTATRMSSLQALVLKRIYLPRTFLHVHFNADFQFQVLIFE